MYLVRNADEVKKIIQLKKILKNEENMLFTKALCNQTEARLLREETNSKICTPQVYTLQTQEVSQGSRKALTIKVYLITSTYM